MTMSDKPYFPAAKPCLSFWQITTRQWSMLHAGSDALLPQSADVVVIGSGLSGVLVAYELLSGPNPPRVLVMLEAREACSGATARNAGHCRPDAYRGFSVYAEMHGNEQAMKILSHERLVLQMMKTFIDTHGIECDFDQCKTLDVIMSQPFLEYANRSFKEFEAAGGDLSEVAWIKSEEGEKIVRVPQALGAIQWTAASLHSAKLCQAITTLSIKLGMSLFAHTPVYSVTPASEGNWNVTTSRGPITAPIVVHATNAYAASLLPSLESAIQPIRGQCHAVVPPPQFSGPSLLTHTYSIRFGLREFYSIAQRKADGVIILSGLNDDVQRERSKWPDDCSASQDVAQNCMRVIRSTFSEWKEESEGEGLQYGWTGIMAMTPDSVPLVGPAPSLPGQYVIAGFNGHGMARIFGCAPGLVKLIRGESWESTGMPECFQITGKRLGGFAKQRKQPA